MGIGIGRDCGLSASRINAAHCWLRDKTWDRHMRSPFCPVTRGLRCGFRNAKWNHVRSPHMHGTNQGASPLLLSMNNSIACGVHGSLREAFGGVG